MPRRLRPDEEALWRSVTLNATPLRPETTAAHSPTPKPPRVRQEPAPSLPDFRIGQAAPPNAPSAAPRAVAPLRVGRRMERDLSRGKRTPEASIDLHGMTLAQAHPTLVRFVLSSFATGRRLVLVVTGKGKGGSGSWYEAKGVLRRQVPEWLTAPPLGNVVQEILPAHRCHGGSGAYYVVLRRG
jgi:DNA-nicking Smr family endonuclease